MAHTEELEQTLARLKEIRETNLGDLNEEEVSRLLAERKALEASEKRLLEAERHAALIAEEAERRTKLEAAIVQLNEEIKPEKPDEELLTLIEKRRALEAELALLEADVHEAKHKKSEEKPQSRAAAKAEPEPAPAATQVPEPEPDPQPEPASEEKVPPHKPFAPPAFGHEEVSYDAPVIGSDVERYLQELDLKRETLDVFLRGLPQSVRANPFFMLKVAEIDPAYAMHYADETLKGDEKFCIKVAGMENRRQTGNALAEMSPEMRTGKVLLAAVAQDFRNVRFARPALPEYDEILALAKRAALERIEALKHATDVTDLLPRVLQKDKAFMAEVAKITAGKS